MISLPKNLIIELKQIFNYRCDITDKSQIKINLKSNRLVVSGSNESDVNKKDNIKDYSHRDRRFNYTIELNNDIDQKTISSNLKNGILTIILPRIATQEGDVKEIPVN